MLRRELRKRRELLKLMLIRERERDLRRIVLKQMLMLRRER